MHFRKAAFPQETKNLELISKIHLHDIFSDLLFLLIPKFPTGENEYTFLASIWQYQKVFLLSYT